jgi:hypothetical protein
MKRLQVLSTWTYLTLSTVFEVCDVGRGNLVISKLLALKKFGPFLRSTYYWMSCSTFLGVVGGRDGVWHLGVVGLAVFLASFRQYCEL